MRGRRSVPRTTGGAAGGRSEGQRQLFLIGTSAGLAVGVEDEERISVDVALRTLVPHPPSNHDRPPTTSANSRSHNSELVGG